MHNNSLFSTAPAEAGFRLQTVEIYNWGVFDGEIYRISPEGNTSLLTGANGSGKTSFVDAILTLIVPERRMRFYNLSSGSAGKNERTEESYVLGEFGDAESAEKGKETLRLRQHKEKTFSVLLARFKNEERFLTLAQVRWFSGSELRRAYIVAQTGLSIQEDFIPFDANGQWRRALRTKHQKLNNREVVEFFDGPAMYGQALRRYLGMRSEKALTLFSQTVGLKVLGNLNEFIRQNMLQESTIEDEFIGLKEGFRKLLDAHTEIEKARQQLDLLQPIVNKEEELKVAKASIKRLTDLKETLPPYFARHKKNLLEKELEVTKAKNRELAEKLLSSKEEIDIKREQEREIDANIRNDEVGKRIQAIHQNILHKQTECNTRKQRCQKYNAAATAIGVSTDPSDYEFAESIETAKARAQEIIGLLPDLENQWADARNELKILRNEQTEIGVQFDALQKQKNNITGRVAEIRSEIVAHCGVTEEEIPFIGELIQVREEEKHWEYGIEKVLHNFALRLIVPDEYYDEVNHYVNNTNLRGRIVYHRFNPKENFINDFTEDVDNSIFSKLELKMDSPYSDWLEHVLKTDYNFVCTDDMTLFRACRRAVTSEGLIKNNQRHEKDDRQKGSSREQFVLGWDNSSKRNHIFKALQEKEGEINRKQTKINDLKRQQETLHGERESITAFLQYDKFEEIDWPQIAVEISELEQQKHQLEKANNRVEELTNQLAALKAEIKEKEKLREELSTEKIRAQDYTEKISMQFEYVKTMLDAYRHVDLRTKYEQFEEEFSVMLAELTAQNIDTIRHKVESEISRRMTEEKEKENRLENRLHNLMRDFREPNDEIRKKFIDWTSDTHKLPTETEYVQEYIDLFNQINEQQLAEYRTRFKKYLNEDMINRMTNFTALLERQEEEINDNVEALNKSLERITFRSNPPTFIQLYAEKENSREIRDFRTRLNGWKPDLTAYEETGNENILEQSFDHIKTLIEDLSDNEIWRRTVTDVRNWFTFKAKEHLTESPETIYKIYESTGKLSGGEKAQLTYTILGSAIAYQFGISQSGMNTNSFRFICVDESFSNQDDEKSRYLMELCRQLHLQLLVVTPEDKMHIVEPYISAVHFVKRHNNRNSVVFDMPIRQFVEQREEARLA